MHAVGSAFAGLQEPFSPNGVIHPTATLLPLQRSMEEEEGEQHPGDNDEEQQINNRTAGGAGKRLSVEDLQVCSCCLFLLLLLLLPPLICSAPIHRLVKLSSMAWPNAFITRLLTSTYCCTVGLGTSSCLLMSSWLNRGCDV